MFSGRRRRRPPGSARRGRGTTASRHGSHRTGGGVLTGTGRTRGSTSATARNSSASRTGTRALRATCGPGPRRSTSSAAAHGPPASGSAATTIANSPITDPRGARTPAP
ncbi:hypothetical protein ACWEOE_39915 [Amycolatopsis sp. NPDC004368]